MMQRRRNGVQAAVEYLPSKEILAKLAKLEEKIQAGMKALEGMLK